MKLLGKIALILTFTCSLFGANIELSSTELVSGEKLIFRLSAKGDNVKFPSIDEIEGFRVSKGGIQRSSSSSIQYINGKITQESTNTFSQTYALFPTKSLTIPAFILDVDGKEQYTQPMQINIISQDKLNSKIPYKVSLHVDNQSPYIGQMFKLSLQIKLSERSGVADIKLGKNGLDKLYIKDKPIQRVKNENGYKIISLEYWASALKAGQINLDAFEVHLGFESASRDNFFVFGQNYDYKTIRSNPLSLHVKALPQGVSAVGEFEISASVDKSEVEAGKPVNVELSISGVGNLSEVEGVKRELKGVNIYDDKPIVSSRIENGVYKSKWSQKLAFVGADDFTIEPFVFKYLDAKTSKIKSISTKPLHVKVKGSVSKSVQVQKSTIELPEKTKMVVKKEGINPLWLILAFILGMCLEFLLIKAKKTNLKKVKIFKNDKELLQEILSFKGKDLELDEQIDKLEANIYEGKSEKIDKKKIKDIITKFS